MVCFTDSGDHAETRFPLTASNRMDQQSKVFSNQIPEESIQAMEVIEGAPPPSSATKQAWSLK